MSGLLGALGWLGARARWVLALGVVGAFLLPGLSAGLRPVLPAFVVLVFAVAVARLDVAAVARAAVRPRRLWRLGGLVALLLWLTPLAHWAAAGALGLTETALAALVYTGAAPPITSAAGLCLLLGLDAALALELTVLASLATPLMGPLAVSLLLGDAAPLDAGALALRMGAMIGAGTALGLLARRLLGPATLARQAKALDGVGAVAMVLFVVPLFDGVWDAAVSDPGRAAAALALATAVNFGTQLALALALRGVVAREVAGALALTWGNRTVALYLAALPPDPAFGLYVALYQIPMLFTPLVMGRVLAGPPRPR